MNAIANFFAGCFSVGLWLVAIGAGCVAALFVFMGWDEHEAPFVGIGAVLGLGAILAGYGAWSLWP